MTWVRSDVLLWGLAALAAAWGLPRRWQAAAVSTLSAAFLAFYAPVSAAILAIFALASYGALARGPVRGPALLGVIGAVGAVWTGCKLAAQASAGAGAAEVAVPLGLSYYALRVIHYAVERYKGTLPPHGLRDYVAYLFFLPILLAGPITGFPEFRRDLERRRFDAALLSRGCERVLHGYAKVVILANYLVSVRLAEIVTSEVGRGTPLGEYLDCLRFGLNLYLQFSGFSDIAIGLSLMMGFRVAENFRWPFLAPNIGDFWRRWHMTLSGWCRAYVYLPVAAATRRPALATVAAMLVLGVWHELSLRFLAWGLYHGLGIVVWQRFRSRRGASGAGPGHPLAHAVSVLFTFHFVMAGFVITKEDSFAAVWQTCRVLLTGWW